MSQKKPRKKLEDYDKLMKAAIVNDRTRVE